MTNTDTDFLHVLRQAEVRTTAAAIDRPTENNYSELTAADAHRRARGAARSCRREGDLLHSLFVSCAGDGRAAGPHINIRAKRATMLPRLGTTLDKRPWRVRSDLVASYEAADKASTYQRS